jgi:hypothetical protein
MFELVSPGQDVEGDVQDVIGLMITPLSRIQNMPKMNL